MTPTSPPERRKRARDHAPWEKPAPAKTTPAHLSPANKRAAKARAKKAGRPYPNLVDNMAQSRRTKGKR